jgi:hypothetical protein
MANSVKLATLYDMGHHLSDVFEIFDLFNPEPFGIRP